MRCQNIFLSLLAFILVQWILFKIFTLYDNLNSNSSPSALKFFRQGQNGAAEEIDDRTVIIYNRIPKTGSTSFMHLPYELYDRNKFNVLLLNISNPHFMTLNDRVYFSKNITSWSEKWPAIYHGHFAYFDVEQFGAKGSPANFVYINVIREPLERLVSYYYFLRYGDDYRKNKIRSRMGDKNTFDQCVQKGMSDCDPKKLWVQVPWFCGHFRRCWEPPGNRWALEQAKFNLANKYFLVGLTEDLETFVDLMELTMPRFFRGAGEIFRSSYETSHIRKTKHKDSPSDETLNILKSTKIWKMEQEFYEFARSHYEAMKQELLEIGPRRVFHYEKVRPRPPS